MPFPAELSNAIDGVTEIIADHLNHLEAKMGTDNSAVATSLDYLLKNEGSIDPGHKHTAVALSGGNDGEVFYKAAGAWVPGTPEAAGLVAKSGDQSLAGVKTFTSIPLGPANNPTADNQLARKAYVDLMLPIATYQSTTSINPGHKHSTLWASDGSPEAVAVDASGNVGFGTTEPQAQVHIYNEDKAKLLMGSADGLARSALIQKDYNSPYNLDIYWSRHATVEAGNLNFHASQDSGALVTFKSNGMVGINNSDPGYLLTMENSGGGYYSASDHSWHNGSSIRWKENPTPIAQALDLVKQLSGVRFNWKGSGICGISLIAEEVAEVVPEAVSFSKDAPGFCDGFNPAALVAVLVEALKEQQVQIEALQAKLN